MKYSTNDLDYKGMKRYETPLWKDLVRAQNHKVDVDILTITGFMKTAKELIDHLNNNK
tara:strand:- start:663 stop:836 length:174 start_codon:yes stop_codon:yes gene_type:complete